MIAEASSLLRSAHGHPASDPDVVRRHRARALAGAPHSGRGNNASQQQMYIVKHPHGPGACLARHVALLCAALGRDLALLHGTPADAWALARTGTGTAHATSAAPAVALMPPYLKVRLPLARLEMPPPALKGLTSRLTKYLLPPYLKVDARLMEPPFPTHVLAVGLRPQSARVVRLTSGGGGGGGGGGGDGGGGGGVAALAAELGRLAEADDVVWIEPWHPVTTHNRYARGTCQSGSYLHQPLDAAGVNLTGHGQVVGVSDTGLDARSCFFVDAAADVPYTDSSGAAAATAAAASGPHRKLVAYVPYKDGVDDEGGHGTHVAATIAGKCDGGKLGAYDGMAYNAKIAFFDIGVTGTPFDAPGGSAASPISRSHPRVSLCR